MSAAAKLTPHAAPNAAAEAAPRAGARRAALPPPRRLAVLGALLAAAMGGAAYVTWGAVAVDATPAPAAPVHAAPRATGGVPAVPAPRDSAATLAVAPATTPAAPPTAAPNASPNAAPAAAPAPAPPPPDTIVVEREVYGYDGGGRRDPFRPLIVTTVLRPFASELRLVAVAYDASGANSVAILRDQTTKAQHRVRVGQLVGRMRVVRIQPKAVVFAVEELGFSRRETLTLHDSLGTSPSGTRQP